MTDVPGPWQFQASCPHCGKELKIEQTDAVTDSHGVVTNPVLRTTISTWTQTTTRWIYNCLVDPNFISANSSRIQHHNVGEGKDGSRIVSVGTCITGKLNEELMQTQEQSALTSA